MMKKQARNLQLGEVFCRQVEEPVNPRADLLHTVERLQFVPLRDFFGHHVETVQITARNHLLGPASLSLGADEEVWVLAPHETPAQPAPSVSPRPTRRRWR